MAHGGEMTFERTPQQSIDETLARWSVSDLREQTSADLTIGDERFYKATFEMHVIDQGRHGLIDWWQIESNGNEYECRRFKNFVFCSCKSFFFSKKMCKHLAITTRVYCANCFQSAAKVGKYCHECSYHINRFKAPAASASV